MVSNTEFAKSDRLFAAACFIAGCAPTKRQASKWRRQKGLAYSKIGDARRKVEQDKQPA